MEEVRKINERGQLVCSIEFNGKEYRRYPNGKHPNYYYHKWKENGRYHQELLHHAVYEFYKGKIPSGKVIHHIDHNPLNNDIGNLVAVTPSEHQKLHPEKLSEYKTREHASKVWFTKSNWDERRRKVDETLSNERWKCQQCGAEYTPTNVHQRFCSKNVTIDGNTHHPNAMLKWFANIAENIHG